MEDLDNITISPQWLLLNSLMMWIQINFHSADADFSKWREPCSIEFANYCQNGGVCQHVPVLDKTHCFCPPSYTGQRCESLFLNLPDLPSLPHSVQGRTSVNSHGSTETSTSLLENDNDGSGDAMNLQNRGTHHRRRHRRRHIGERRRQHHHFTDNLGEGSEARSADDRLFGGNTNRRRHHNGGRRGLWDTTRHNSDTIGRNRSNVTENNDTDEARSVTNKRRRRRRLRRLQYSP